MKTGTKQIAYNINTIGDFDIKVGNVYLFTYFDENNPTDIFDIGITVPAGSREDFVYSDEIICPIGDTITMLFSMTAPLTQLLHKFSK